MSDTILLSKFHRSSPRVGGPYELAPLAERTADWFSDQFYIANGVEQIYWEMKVTALTGTAKVTPWLQFFMPSGDELQFGFGQQASAVASYTSGFGIGVDTAIGRKVSRLLLTDVIYRLNLN
ncbi:hypothetical protein LCGC14_2517440, partial [marine sediment metagenome]